MNSSSTASSEPRPRAPAWIRSTALFLLMLAGAVTAVGQWGRAGATDRWYGTLFERIRSGDRPHYIFVGTSRVAAAIDVEAFDREAASPNASINLGQGYSTIVEHYFGLRDALALDPRAFDHCTVFLEAPLGLPDDRRWDWDWVIEDQPENILPTMRASDLPRMWREASMPMSTRLFITAAVIAPPLGGIPPARAKAMTRLQNALATLFAPLAPPPQEAAADLPNRGGIVNDAAGVAYARRLAELDAHDDTVHQQPIRNFDGSVIEAIVKMVRGGGGDVVFYEMPLSDVQRTPYETPLRVADRAAFGETLERWGCRMLRPDFQTEPGDFPDEWHMRRSRAPDFSRQLAAAWLADGPAPPLGTALGLRPTTGVRVTGLHALEKDVTGADFRWTDGAATIDVAMPTPAPRRLLLQVETPRPTRLQVRVNGPRVLDETLPAGSTTRMLPLPDAPPSGRARIVLISDTFVPHALDPRTVDTRRLGVVLRTVKLLP